MLFAWLNTALEILQFHHARTLASARGGWEQSAGVLWEFEGISESSGSNVEDGRQQLCFVLFCFNPAKDLKQNE